MKHICLQIEMISNLNGQPKLQQEKTLDLITSLTNVEENLIYESTKLVFQKLPPYISKQLYMLSLEYIQTRLISFEEHAIDIRMNLSEIYDKEEDWKEAADVLSAIPIETGQKQYPKDFKLKIYVKIADLYLNAGDDAQAEAFINRASLLQTDVNDEQLQIKYKLTYARVLDNRRKFIESAQKYLELSYKSALNEAERNQALEQALNCAILAPAGQPRSRFLALLYKDERCRALSFDILEKMYLDRIIRRDQFKEFEKSLPHHQKAQNIDGTTILEKAIMQHNLLSASNIYLNISFEQLALLLEISEDKAESIASQMISEGRLEGKIDQIEKFIYFKGNRDNADMPSQELCIQLNSLFDKIELLYKKDISTL
ncbi:unnamed protein product [Gordionus sp. m RMFG-2023]